METWKSKERVSGHTLYKINVSKYTIWPERRPVQKHLWGVSSMKKPKQRYNTSRLLHENHNSKLCGRREEHLWFGIEICDYSQNTSSCC